MDVTGTTAVDRLDGVLAWNVLRAARSVGNRLAERLTGHGLNPVQFGVLAFLADRTAMTTAEIAREVLLRPQSVAPLLDQLEERGLARRSGTREKGRRNPIEITDAGRAALDGAWATAAEAGDLSDLGITEQESRQLNALLLRIIAGTSG
ncbi:MarR family transcriptional regulator [Klenkia sp. LSe6-5]|uniref:MarR family transcriptional regulator n=1 Tax=Klenkia sesuvii TaxID=3103137 RepID=A0ABU8DSC9_9ACTN